MMDDDSMQEHARLLAVLANPTRLRILRLLLQAQGTVAVEDLVKRIGGLGQPTISHHLSALKKAQIVELTTRCGLYHYYTVNKDMADKASMTLYKIFDSRDETNK